MIGIINVIDLEFECWKNKGPGKIIQIGICEFDCRTGEIKNPSSFFVGGYPLSKFCVDLLSIDIDRYKQESIPLEQCINKINYKYNMNKRHWVSWGDTDRIKLRKEKIRTGPHLNLRPIYEIKTNKRAKGLFASMESIDLSPFGDHHNAMHDALNCAILLREIFK